MAGRIVAVAWLFWLAAFWVGQIVGALTTPTVAGIAVFSVASLVAYFVLRWDRISSWAMIAAALLWLVGFPFLVWTTGGDNALAATAVSFTFFALPALVAGVLILDSRRRLGAQRVVTQHKQ
jgi:hypothetical protein